MSRFDTLYNLFVEATTEQIITYPQLVKVAGLPGDDPESVKKVQATMA